MTRARAAEWKAQQARFEEQLRQQQTLQLQALSQQIAALPPLEGARVGWSEQTSFLRQLEGASSAAAAALDGTVRARNVACPHAGCFVEYRSGRNHYFCPCHNSSFGLDGKVQDPKSPSPRALDDLKVEIRNGGEVWVTFQNFRAGVHDKIPA